MADIVAEDRGTPPMDPDGTFVTRRWVEVRAGEYSPESVIRDGGESITVDGSVTVDGPVSVSAPEITELFTSNAAIAAQGSVVSGWIDISNYSVLFVIRKITLGTYSFEVDWSRDGANADVTEVLATTDDASTKKDIGAKFARLRIRNTDAAVAFTGHVTVVNAR